MWRAMIGCWGIVVGLAMVGSSSLANAAEPAVAERFLEVDPLAFAEIRSPGEWIERLEGDRFGGLVRALPDVQKALQGDDVQQLRQIVDFVATTLDTTAEEGLRHLVGGGVLVALEGADSPRLVVVITPEDPEFLERAHQRIVELAREDARNKDKSDPVQEDEYRGLTGYRFSKDEAHAIVDGHLIIASGSEALKAVIDRHLDGGPTLDQDPSWQDRRSTVDPDSLAWAFADLERLRELDPKRYAGLERVEPPVQFLLGTWVEALSKAPWALAEFQWTEDRLAASLKVPTPPEGYSETLQRFLPTPGQGAPASLNLPGTIASVRLWRDLSAVWEVRADLFPPEVLQGFAQLDTVAGQFFGGRDFGEGVLGALGAHWQIVVVEQDHETLQPTPEIKLPAFALIVELRPDDEEFARRLQVAFQSIIGLANLGTAQTGAPPLMLGSEVHGGVSISTATFMTPARGEDPATEVIEEPEAESPVHYRHNFAPSAAKAGDHFIISSNIPLTRSLVEALQAEQDPEATEETLAIEMNGLALATLAEANRERLVLQNMLKEGNTKAVAENNVDVFLALLRYFGQGKLQVIDSPEEMQLRLEFLLGEASQIAGNSSDEN